MLSCNDCYPGCSCDDDHFQITTERVTEWLITDGMGKARETIRQLEELKQSSNKGLKGLPDQLNMVFSSKEGWELWLDDWTRSIKIGMSEMHYSKNKK